MWDYVLGSIIFVIIVGSIASVWVESRRRREVLEGGESVVGWLVQANTAMFRPGSESLPAQVLISFPGPRQSTLEQLADLARRVAVLKSGPPSDDVEKRVAKLVRNELYRPNVRHELPASFTGGPEVYSVHVIVERSLLPDGQITVPYFLCKAAPGGRGAVYMVGYPEGEADTAEEI